MIVAPQPEITPPVLEVKVLTTKLPGKPHNYTISILQMRK